MMGLGLGEANAVDLMTTPLLLYDQDEINGDGTTLQQWNLTIDRCG
jgi:hypothetical protein